MRLTLNPDPSPQSATREGAPAAELTVSRKLRRSVCSCLLWEDEFYEDGEEIARRIVSLARQVSPGELAGLAVHARTDLNLRHVPLLLLAVLERTGTGSSLVSDTIAQVITRADEPAELLCLIAELNGRTPRNLRGKISAQVKKGLARAMTKFDSYELGKYNRRKDAPVWLRDILRLVHPAPETILQDANWQNVVQNTLPPADTWEVALAQGVDKKATFERLLSEGRLGYLALLRNLSLMTDAGVEEGLIRQSILERRGARRVLPFRYLAAARAAPRFEPELDQAMMKSLEHTVPFEGKTLILVDVSGSMLARLSAKSAMTRLDAAAALAVLFPGEKRILSFSDELVEVPARNGMAGIDAVHHSQRHGGTWLGSALGIVSRGFLSFGPFGPFDRLVVITDEQSHDRVDLPGGVKGYMVNIASNRNGVGYGDWVRIDGFSEGVLTFMREYEH